MISAVCDKDTLELARALWIVGAFEAGEVRESYYMPTGVIAMIDMDVIIEPKPYQAGLLYGEQHPASMFVWPPVWPSTLQFRGVTA